MVWLVKSGVVRGSVSVTRESVRATLRVFVRSQNTMKRSHPSERCSPELIHRNLDLSTFRTPHVIDSTISTLAYFLGTYRLFAWVKGYDPWTFLDESSKEYITQSCMSAQDQAKYDSSERESGFGFGGYLGFGLFDECFG
jgi:hypothetical protein